jgi:hypothetical protein
MTRTSRFTSILSIVAAGLMFSAALAVEPGETVDLKDTASISPCLTDVLLDPNAPDGVSADADCSETAGLMQARSTLELLMDTEAAASASAALLYEFEVDAGEETDGNMVDAILGYAMSWRGVNKINDAGVFNVELRLAVENISDSGSPVEVVTIPVHGKDCLIPDAACFAGGIDVGSEQELVPLKLVRGDTYRVTAYLSTASAVADTAAVSSAVADYLNDVGNDNEPAGAWVDTLVLQVALDLEDLAAQVEANTKAILLNAEAIEENTVAILLNAEAINDLAAAVLLLADEVEAIKVVLEDLGDELANHTHYYLTGKGVGHNNTMAETGPASGEDVEIQPVKTNRGRSKKFSR